jgi:hypothetical protein
MLLFDSWGWLHVEGSKFNGKGNVHNAKDKDIKNSS